MLGASALMSVAMLPRADLHDIPFVQNLNHALAEAQDPFAVVRQGDVLLHHPYDSFQPVLHFLRRAAEDPSVLAIKMTLYRTGSNSEIVKALIAAAENGKQVAVAIELKARFDEQNNIVWARQLERAGVHVFVRLGRAQDPRQGHPGGAPGGRRRSAATSTSPPATTTSAPPGCTPTSGCSRADQSLGEDVSEVFNALSGFAKVARYRKLAVAPVTLAETVLRKISEQTERARQGKPARIYAKMNALVDLAVIDALYLASQAGVPGGPLRAGHLLPAAGARRCLGEHPGVQHRRPVPRALPGPRLRRGGAGGALPLLGGLDAPQPLPPGGADVPGG